jgi:hypothetical protein
MMAALAVAVMASASVAAQSVPGVKLPASPRGQAAIQVGGTWVDANGGRQYRDGKWITVDYGRPILRGRTNIFGTLADYGTAISEGAPVWRAGANETTRLTTQVPLRFGGNTVQPGVYNVLVELKGGAWTLVLSTQEIQERYDPNEKVKLYGSYNYDAKFDVLRAPMIVEEAPVSFEQFTIDFVDVTPTGGTLLMVWERTVAMVPFTVQ